MHIRAFDFDKTLYDGYVGRDFSFFMIGKRPWLVLWAPYIAVVALLALFRLISIRHTVEWILFPFTRSKHIEKYVKAFWDKKEKKIAEWYKEKHLPTDVVISASPDFILKDILTRLGVTTYVCTEMDVRTCKIVGVYCFGEGKWTKLTQSYGEDVEIEEYYTDSLRDRFLLDKAKKGFLVNKGNIEQVH